MNMMTKENSPGNPAGTASSRANATESIKLNLTISSSYLYGERFAELTYVKPLKGGATVYTDEFPSYRNLGKRYDHQHVNHSAKEYVYGMATPTA